LSRAKLLCGKMGLNPMSRMEQVEGHAALMSTVLAREVATKRDQEDIIGINIRKKITMHCYQGVRHQYGLPVHGQRTKTNAVSQKRLARVRAGKFGYKLLQSKRVPKK
jgi:small subunit ribosomal protein S13